MAIRANKRFGALCLLFCCPILSCSPLPPGSAPDHSIEAGWKPLFDGSSLGNWQVTNFGGEGKVIPGQGQVILERGENLTGITWGGANLPGSGYELRLEASRQGGNDFFCGLTFPVQEEYATLIVGGWGGTVVGISSVDGQDASENETTRSMVFETGRWYAVRLRVSETRIEVWIDDEQVIDLATGGKRFSVRPEVRLSRPLGIASWRTRAGLRAIRWKEL